MKLKIETPRKLPLNTLNQNLNNNIRHSLSVIQIQTAALSALWQYKMPTKHPNADGHYTNIYCEWEDTSRGQQCTSKQYKGVAAPPVPDLGLWQRKFTTTVWDVCVCARECLMSRVWPTWTWPATPDLQSMAMKLWHWALQHMGLKM